MYEKALTAAVYRRSRNHMVQRLVIAVALLAAFALLLGLPRVYSRTSDDVGVPTIRLQPDRAVRRGPTPERREGDERRSRPRRGRSRPSPPASTPAPLAPVPAPPGDDDDPDDGGDDDDGAGD